jgi:hypothetical protein
MSLLWIIPAVWLLVAVAVVLLCRDAQRGDAVQDEAIEPARRRAELSGVVVLKETSSLLSAGESDDPAADMNSEPRTDYEHEPASVGG